MDQYPGGEAASGTRRTLLPVILVLVVAFLLGVAAMGWLLAQSDSARRLVGIEPPPQAAPAVQPLAPTTALPAATDGLDRVVIDPEVSRRVASLEARLNALDAEAQMAVGNADRAEGLLVAFAARRALDRGVGLGYIEALLRERFGRTQRQAVATIITASREPVTIQELQLGLAEVGEQLVGVGPDQNWWGALRTELGELITLRRAGTPSTLPEERLARARRWLEAGQVDVALAEVLRMPGRNHARAWVADARRYVAARRALDRIEAAALLSPGVQQARP